MSVKPPNATEVAPNGTTTGSRNTSGTTSAGVLANTAGKRAKGVIGEALWTLVVVAFAVAHVKSQEGPIYPVDGLVSKLCRYDQCAHFAELC